MLQGLVVAVDSTPAPFVTMRLQTVLPAPSSSSTDHPVHSFSCKNTPVAPVAVAPVAIPPRKKANTYSVLINDTTGWLPASDNSTKLSKADANQQYLNLMDVEGYAPDRIKVVVDGQVD